MPYFRAPLFTAMAVLLQANVATGCTVILSRSDISEFESKSHVILEALKAERLPQLLTQQASIDFDSIHDWLIMQLCPFQKQLSSRATAEISKSADANKWMAQANSLMHVRLNAAAPNYLSLIGDSLQKFEQASPTASSGTDRSKEIKAARELLASVGKNAKQNAEVADTKTLVSLFGSPEGTVLK